MKMMFAAIALAVASPSVVHAQAAAAPEPARHCCCDDDAKPMDCCAKHGDRDKGAAGHAGDDRHEQHEQHKQ